MAFRNGFETLAVSYFTTTILPLFSSQYLSPLNSSFQLLSTFLFSPFQKVMFSTVRLLRCFVDGFCDLLFVLSFSIFLTSLLLYHSGHLYVLTSARSSHRYPLFFYKHTQSCGIFHCFAPYFPDRSGQRGESHRDTRDTDSQNQRSLFSRQCIFKCKHRLLIHVL